MSVRPSNGKFYTSASRVYPISCNRLMRSSAGMPDSHLIRVLRSEMRQRGLTQHGLAVAAGLHKDTIRNIFRRTSRMPRPATLQALAEYLKVTVDYLLGRDPAEPATDGQGEVSTVPRIPSGKPGLPEWEEIQRFWGSASPDARRALVYLARTMAKAEAPEPRTRPGTKAPKPTSSPKKAG